MTDRSLYFADISSNNPLPDLAAYVAAGHQWLARKVTEGTGYRWFEGDAVADEAHRLGLHLFHYHWLTPGPAATQAASFIGAVKAHLKPGDKLMTDFERSPQPDPVDSIRAAQIRDFNHFVTTALPDNELTVYTGNWYLDGKPACQAETRKWPVILSDYTDAADAQINNRYGLDLIVRQLTDRATVPGFSAPVDYNHWLKPPKPHDEGFVMDKEAKDRFQEIETKIDALTQKVENLFSHGSDGDPDQLASIVRQELRAVGLTAKDAK